MKKMSLSLLFALFAWSPLAAVAADAPAQTPQETLQKTVENVQHLIAKNHQEYKAHPKDFYTVIDKVLIPHFDVPYISQLVLGLYWRQATPKQRTEFQDAFTHMLIRSYANALLENYDSVKVQWLPSRVDSQAETATVNTVLIRGDGRKYPISFSMRKVDGHWKIYDIVIDNLSLALNFRSQIVGQVKAVGLQKVIQKMQARAAQ